MEAQNQVGSADPMNRAKQSMTVGGKYKVCSEMMVCKTAGGLEEPFSWVILGLDHVARLSQTHNIRRDHAGHPTALRQGVL